MFYVCVSLVFHVFVLFASCSKCSICSIWLYVVHRLCLFSFQIVLCVISRCTSCICLSWLCLFYCSSCSNCYMCCRSLCFFFCISCNSYMFPSCRMFDGCISWIYCICSFFHVALNVMCVLIRSMSRTSCICVVHCKLF